MGFIDFLKWTKWTSANTWKSRPLNADYDPADNFYKEIDQNDVLRNQPTNIRFTVILKGQLSTALERNAMLQTWALTPPLRSRKGRGCCWFSVDVKKLHKRGFYNTGFTTVKASRILLPQEHTHAPTCFTCGLGDCPCDLLRTKTPENFCQWGSTRPRLLAIDNNPSDKRMCSNHLDYTCKRDFSLPSSTITPRSEGFVALRIRISLIGIK